MVEQARLAGEQIHHFHGGLRLRHNKKVSCETPLKRPSLPALLKIPLVQHADVNVQAHVHCLVHPGDVVLKGQAIGRFDDIGGGLVHASTSGVVTDISLQPISHPSGQSGLCVSLEPDGRDAWCAYEPVSDWAHTEPLELLERLLRSGIVGLGGAVFPTGHKLQRARQNQVHTLILNGAECEPYISCDEMLMREHPDRLLLGAHILKHMLGAQRVLIAIEDQMGVIHRVLNQLIKKPGNEDIDVVKVTTIYPEGGERQLIQVLTGLEVPAKGYPIDVGLICFNVGTAGAVAQSITSGRPMVERIVSVTGPGIVRPRNFIALLGTPISHLVAHCDGYTDDAARLIVGGPMMGYALSADDNPIIKAANCILVLTEQNIHNAQPEMPCIRCGACARVCPAILLPQLLHQQVVDELWAPAADNGLNDCIECGCCDFVCPSHIPLTDWFRYGKGALDRAVAEDERAEAAKLRFEARNTRLSDRKDARNERITAQKISVRQDARARIDALTNQAKDQEESGGLK